MNTTRDVELPGSFDQPERSGLRGRLDAWKSRGMAKVHDVQRIVSERSTAARGSLMHATHSARDGAKVRLDQVQSSMRTSPMKWAGIAAGAGFGIGLIGRIAHWRKAHRRMMPDLVIIESSC